MKMDKETKRLIVDAVIALLIVAVIFVLVFVLGSFGVCINHCGDCFTPCNLTALSCSLEQQGFEIVP